MATKPARSTSPRRRPRFSLKWAAGFVDGEGCISIVKQAYKDARRKPMYRVSFSITLNELSVLEHLQSGLGKAGRIYKVVFERLPTLKNRDLAQLPSHNWRPVSDIAEAATATATATVAEPA